MKELHQLRLEIINCSKCSEKEEYDKCGMSNVVSPISHTGGVGGDILVLLNQVTSDAQLYEEACIPSTQRVINKIFDDGGIDSRRLVITNIVKCSCVKKGWSNCRFWLIRQNEVIQPKTIFVLGIDTIRTIMDNKHYKPELYNEVFCPLLNRNIHLLPASPIINSKHYKEIVSYLQRTFNAKTTESGT